jgi:hypothetical protein
MRQLFLLPLVALLACTSATATQQPHAVTVEPAGSGEALEPEPRAAPRPRAGVAATCSNALALGTIDPKAPLASLLPAGGSNVMSPHFSGGSGFFAVEGVAPGPRDGGDAPLEVSLRGPAKIGAGAPLELRASFANHGQEALTLVRPLDGSFERMRYPSYDLYARDEASGAVFRYAFVGGRCGMVNPITVDDYATVAPGARRDDVVDNGWASHIGGSLIARPGRYSLWLVYSFCGFEEGGLKSGGGEQRAAYVGVHASNAVTIEVI